MAAWEQRASINIFIREFVPIEDDNLQKDIPIIHVCFPNPTSMNTEVQAKMLTYPEHRHADDHAGVLLRSQRLIYLTKIALGLSPASGLYLDALGRHFRDDDCERWLKGWSLIKSRIAQGANDYVARGRRLRDTLEK